MLVPDIVVTTHPFSLETLKLHRLLKTPVRGVWPI
jgi:hypothetical protein